MKKGPGCHFIHGRCMDAVYPFLHMAKVTGGEEYLTAGIEVFEWAKNVSLESGAWLNDLDRKSWQGTTLFGAIALGEALHHHGDLLDDATRQRWTERLGQAGDFIHQKIDRLGQPHQRQLPAGLCADGRSPPGLCHGRD